MLESKSIEFDPFHAKFDLFKKQTLAFFMQKWTSILSKKYVFCLKDAILNHLGLDLGKIRPKTTTLGRI